MIGLKSGAVLLEEYDPNWEILFEMEKEYLLKNIGKRCLLIEHIGSTAIRGMMAKPIIDILIVFPNVDNVDSCVALFKELSYSKGSFQPEGEVLLKKGQNDVDTHYLHMMANDSNWRQYIWFRDYLRHNTSIARDYETLKSRLARVFPNNRRAYTSAKKEFVHNILEEINAVKTTKI